MILPEGVGMVIPKHEFSAVVCSRLPKRSVIERNLYIIYLYNDRAFMRFKDENDQEIHVRLDGKDITKLLFLKVEMLIGLLDDMRGKDLNDFYNRKSIDEVFREVSELGDWFLEKNGFMGEKDGR